MDSARPDFWSDNERAQQVSKERADLESQLTRIDELQVAIADVEALFELCQESQDEDLVAEFESELKRIEQNLAAFELTRMLSGPHDEQNAIVEINAGAGGVDSQDWAEMLLRMYLRWAEGRGYRSQVLDISSGEEAGIRSATVFLEGIYAYGYLRSERGVHRLVRISPFDANKRRQTSFASVAVLPEIDDDIDVEVNEADLRVDTYRSSGAGGQHVNKTDSAIRITHLPTGLIVECQDERSQHKNRSRAMGLLKAKLLAAEQARRDAAQAQSRRLQVGSGDRSERIRTYNFPQGRVTDHRIELTLYRLEAVMDGDLDEVIEPLLQEHQAEMLADEA
ncbi:MAG: peptide chain release factor 2 [Bdellovibrionales bacterium]|nr:peptide chain release factor 2 [Bdellovibrionales bacterium]